MAISTVKSTYALDVQTVRALEEIASEWGVSKSEALRRAIRAAHLGAPSRAPSALAALDALQVSLDPSILASPNRAKPDWEKEMRAERRATSRRHEAK